MADTLHVHITGGKPLVLKAQKVLRSPLQLVARALPPLPVIPHRAEVWYCGGQLLRFLRTARWESCGVTSFWSLDSCRYPCCIYPIDPHSDCPPYERILAFQEIPKHQTSGCTSKISQISTCRKVMTHGRNWFLYCHQSWRLTTLTPSAKLEEIGWIAEHFQICLWAVSWCLQDVLQFWCWMGAVWSHCQIQVSSETNLLATWFVKPSLLVYLEVSNIHCYPLVPLVVHTYIAFLFDQSPKPAKLYIWMIYRPTLDFAAIGLCRSHCTPVPLLDSVKRIWRERSTSWNLCLGVSSHPGGPRSPVFLFGWSTNMVTSWLG